MGGDQRRALFLGNRVAEASAALRRLQQTSTKEKFFVRRDIEKVYSRKAFVAKLRRLADALERGERFVTLVAGRRVVVPRAAVFGIEHEREAGVEEIEFQIRWKTARRKKRLLNSYLLARRRKRHTSLYRHHEKPSDIPT